LASKFRSRLELWNDSSRLGILATAFEVRVREAVNGEFYTQFIYPREEDDAERYAALVEGNNVVFPQDIERGQRFRIRRVEEVREGKKIYKVVEAHHIAYTLNNYFLDSYIDFSAAKTLPEMLTILGADTPFTFAVEGSFSAQDIFDFGEKRKMELLQELRQLYGAELSFDNYVITLTSRKGGNYGARVRYAHNMKGIRKTSHDMERITRLFGYGKNGLTIEGMPGHTVKYIDSPYLDPANPLMGKMEWPDIETPARLLQEMEKHLANYELPNVSYNTDFVQMEKIDPEFQSERIREAGDTVTVLDNVLGYSFDARAMEFERYPFEPKRGNAVLSNFRQLRTADYIFAATVGSKKAISYTSKNAVLKGQKYDDSLTLVDGLGMKVTDDFNRERLRIGQTGPGEYGLAMYNKAGDKTIWQDATTGDAKFKGILEASSFQGGSIAIGTAFSVNSAGHMTAVGGDFSGTISASVINGGQIIGPYIATSASYPKAEMSSTDNFFKASTSANKFVSILPYYNPTNAPMIQLTDLSYPSSVDMYINPLNGKFTIISANSIRISSNGNDIEVSNVGIKVPDWVSFYSGATSQTLQQALDAKATKSSSTGSAGSANGGIPPGTVLMVSGGGTVTWNGIPTHTHTQS
jgi:phage minor structural protein